MNAYAWDLFLEELPEMNTSRSLKPHTVSITKLTQG